MSAGQKTFHLLMIVVMRHDGHRTWGAANGTDELPFFLDNLIEYICPPENNTNEDRQVINERIQYLGQLPNSCQTVGASLKPTFMNLRALQKEH